jgi:nucleoside phosphorylase
VRILVTFAMENEFAPWRAMHTFEKSKWGDEEAYFANIGAADVGVMLTGVGHDRAGLAAANVIWGESHSIDACISTGLAGALKPEYRIGQVLAARRVASEAKRTPDRLMPGSELLLAIAGRHGATLVDRFYTSERMVTSAADKHRLGAEADAVEMESFDILLESWAFGVPAVAIRAISDRVDEDLPLDLNRVLTGEGEISVPRVLGQVAMSPKAIPGLIRLGKQSRSAAGELAKFLDSYVVAVAEQSTASLTALAASVR